MKRSAQAGSRIEAGVAPVEAVHDFGTVLAHGQVLRHDFEVVNSSDSTLVLRSGVATTPCCSSIGPLPESIPPRGRVVIPTNYKPGQRSGPGRVGFELHAGPEGEREIFLTLAATLVSEFDVEGLGGTVDHLVPGGTTSRDFRIILRRMGSEGLDPPSAVRSSSGLEARFLGPPHIERHGEISESLLQIGLQILASRATGHHQGSVELLWPDGRERSIPVAWEVDAPVRMTPSAMILHRDAGKSTHILTIHSDARPIRILAVTGSLVVGFVDEPNGPSIAHRLRVELDPRRAEASTASDLVVETDHPDQPRLKSSAIILPGPQVAKE